MITNVEQLRQRIVGFDKNQWIALIEHLMFNESDDQSIQHVGQALTMLVPGGIDELFRVLFNMSKIDRGKAYTQFENALVQTMCNTQINTYTAKGIEFLIRYARIIKPVRHTSHILNFIREKEALLNEIIVSENYTCLRLSLDLLLAVLDLGNVGIESYLFNRTFRPKAPPYFPAYLYKYFSAAGDEDGIILILREVALPGIESDIINSVRLDITLKAIRVDEYRSLSWRKFFLLLHRHNTYAKCDAYAKEAMNIFFVDACNFFKVDVQDSGALPTDTCYLFYLTDLFVHTDYRNRIENLESRILSDLKNFANIDMTKVTSDKRKEKALLFEQLSINH